VSGGGDSDFNFRRASTGSSLVGVSSAVFIGAFERALPDGAAGGPALYWFSNENFRLFPQKKFHARSRKVGPSQFLFLCIEGGFQESSSR